MGFVFISIFIPPPFLLGFVLSLVLALIMDTPCDFVYKLSKKTKQKKCRIHVIFFKSIYYAGINAHYIVQLCFLPEGGL